MSNRIDFEKSGGLVPAIVQDESTREVLMLGYMNEEAYRRTCESGLVTFFSRSKKRLWMKGESSGNVLRVREMRSDCDGDAILIAAIPEGATCHTGRQSCFGEGSTPPLTFLSALGRTIATRRVEGDSATSYTAQLFARGTDAMAQKVGEEAVEVVIEAKNGDRERLVEESADLLFHLMVLLEANGLGLHEVAECLKGRAQGCVVTT